MASKNIPLPLLDSHCMRYQPRPTTRRQMLMQAACGFGYLALADLVARGSSTDAPSPSSSSANSKPVYENPLAAKQPMMAAKAKRVIFLYMEGGPSHVDTFDYKPKLQSDGGKQYNNGQLLPSPFKFIRSGKSGLMISEIFPNLSRHADQMCLINGMYTDNPAHPQATIMLHTGSSQFIRPSMGAWVLYGLGTTNQNLPGFITINPPAGVGGAQNYGSAFLPAMYQGTRIDRNGTVADITNPHVIPQMQQRQIQLIQQMNQSFERRTGDPDQVEGVIQSLELGFRMQMAVPELMDIKNESPATLALYGIGTGNSAGRGGRGGGNNEFGEQLLMARRFAQAGVRYIEVNLGGWDNHNNLKQSLTRNGANADQAIAGLLTDLQSHDMLKDTLVVWGGEFGRTPAGQGTDGRNHNNRGFSMWMAGGGVKGGTTVGKTDDYGGVAVDNKVHIHDMHATVLALLGLDPDKLTYKYAGRDFKLIDTKGHVVPQIMA
jgi:hypothetical protein